MKKKTRNILLSILIGAFLLCAIVGGTVYYYLFAPQFHPSKTVYVYTVSYTHLTLPTKLEV